MNTKPGWERGLPFSENPLAVVQAVLAGVNEGRLDFDSSPRPMLPVVPSEIPAQPCDDIRVEPDFQLPPGIAADDPIREELALPKEQRYFA